MKKQTLIHNQICVEGLLLKPIEPKGFVLLWCMLKGDYLIFYKYDKTEEKEWINDNIPYDVQHISYYNAISGGPQDNNSPQELRYLITLEYEGCNGMHHRMNMMNGDNVLPQKLIHLIK